MKNFFLIALSIFFYSNIPAQPSDFLALKKNQKTIQSFFSGSNISFTTDMGFYSGRIMIVKKDSIFLNQYDIRQMPTNLGVYVLDTVAVYHLAFNYKNIILIGKKERTGFNLSGSGGALLGGGVVIAAVGLGTWVFTKPGSQYHASPYLVGSAALLAGVGYLLLKTNNNYKLGKKYHLEYIKVK